ncbi:MAG: CvpA family protein [Ruminococcus sp.]|nr:CvpA family protein [Ruminococcus sp.]
MGSQFWWFYDVLFVAVILVMVYLSAKRGIFKSLLHFSGYFLAVVIAFSVSGSIANVLYKNSIRNSNIKNLKTTLDEIDFIMDSINLIETEFDFNGEISYNRMEKIYIEKNSLGYSYDKQIYQYVSSIYTGKIENEKLFYNRLHKAYGVYISNIVDDELNTYAAETALRSIIDKPKQMDELIPLLLEHEDRSAAAEYIADKYTAGPYKSIVRLISFISILMVIIGITILLTNTTFKTPGFQSLGSHIGGGVVGILLGLVIVVFITACIRLNVICGENKMLFFNNEAIDNTHLFRHIYNFITLNL